MGLNKTLFMKRLLLTGLVLTMLACEEEKPKIDYALLSGKIENPAAESLAVFKGNDLVKKMVVNKDGTFADTLKIEDGYYRFNHGREGSLMYITPGDDLTLSLNTEEFDESIKYAGIGAENSNFLASKFLAEEKLDLNYTKIFAMEENDFLSMMNEIKSSKLEFLKASKDISNTLRNLEEKNIEYEHLTNLFNYKSYHAYYAKKEDFTPSKAFTTLFDNVDFNNQNDYETLESYKGLVIEYYMNKIGDSANPKEVFDAINTNTFPALKEDLANNLRYNIDPNNEHNEAYYNGLMAISQDEAFKKEITTKYNKVKNLAKGMPSPKFVNYENHKGGTTSLDDLKGKYVYIDVWATWCGPCIREIPSLKKVEKQYHNKNIAFVSMSIDRAAAHNKWFEMVKDKELGGIQIIADKDWSSQFVKDYAIEGIPRFILLDPQGNIVSANAPRPSNPALIKLFDELSI